MQSKESTKTIQSAVNIDAVIIAESEAIERLCKSRGAAPKLNPVDSVPNAHPDRIGVACSGGGIRSASVNLGVIQALAKQDILKQVHYICGVSGGGYILGWLTAWIARMGFAHVQSELENNSATGTPLETPTKTKFPRYLEPNPIHYLREYVSYLIPRSSLGSGDTLAAIAIYLRNLLLVQTLAALALISVIALFQMATPPQLWNLIRLHCSPCLALSAIVVTTLVTAGAVGRSLGYLARNQVPPSKFRMSRIAQYVGLLLCVSIWLGLPILLRTYSDIRISMGAMVWVALFCCVAASFAHWGFEEGPILNAVNAKYIFLVRALAILAAGAFAVLLTHLQQLWLVTGAKGTIAGTEIWIGNSYAILGLPAILLAISLTSYLYIGILGSALPDAKREWLGRLSGYYLYFAIGIAVLLFSVLLGPACMSWLFLKPHAQMQNAILKWILPGGWIFTTLGGLFAAHSPATSDGSRNRTLEAAAAIAPPVFLVGLLFLGAWGTHALVMHFTDHEYLTYGKAQANTASANRCATCTPAPATVWHWENHAVDFAEAASPLRAGVNSGNNCGLILLGVLLTTGLLTFLLGSRLSVNEFSLHLFYRNRLVRTFLGASNVDAKGISKRRVNPFTGFALDDDVFLGSLQNTAFNGPYPIWAAALNLTTGEDLAWQERKAASFIFSPFFCGWDRYSNRPAESAHGGLSQDAYFPVAECKPDGETDAIGYGGKGGMPLIGTAMAAAGAAISPNWGYHTKPAIAALLAVFNIRIGWWTGNPRSSKYALKYAPKADYYLRELLGLTGENSHFVYLSDGGHFENLGIYELVRRRVKYIIACDADSDGQYTFGDLANAVEKCRVDFGVQIELKDYLSIAPEKPGGKSSIHYSVGAIHYLPISPADSPTTGVLLYIKSSLTGDETAQVLGQQASDSAFPHDTTLDQFFDETRFEAYRSLGEHLGSIIWEAFLVNQKDKELKPPTNELERCRQLRDFFEQFLLSGRWLEVVKKLQGTEES